MLIRLFLTQNVVNLKVEQADLDQHRSSPLIVINDNISLADLEGLPDKPPLLKPFPTNCFSFEDFFQIPQVQGLMEYPLRSTKSVPKQASFFLSSFFLV